VEGKGECEKEEVEQLKAEGLKEEGVFRGCVPWGQLY